MLMLALSCLQTRPIFDAISELEILKPDGIQLTPGCVPNAAWSMVHAGLHAHGFKISYHHGFSWSAYRQPVWDQDCHREIEPGERSVHPPKRMVTANPDWFDWIRDEATLHEDLSYETIYSGYYLGDLGEINEAMELGLRLAVDLSHINIQNGSKNYQPGLFEKLLRYPNVSEIHISDNDGRRDLHRPISKDTFGLSIAREFLKTDVPVVLESYFHKLSVDDRNRQLDLLRE